MEIFKDLSEVTKNKNTVLTIGTFDGIHLGHKKIIEQVNEKAKLNGGRSFVVTFYPHPRNVVSGNFKIMMLNTLSEKILLFENLGVDNLLILKFTKEFSQLSSEKFLKEYIVDGIGVSEIVIGYDHHFGKERDGDESTLRRIGKQYGFMVSKVNAIMINNQAVSSTKIRNALLHGNMEIANSYLGHFYSFSGTVIPGDKRGRQLGYPTANIQIDDEAKLLPAIGIYAVEFIVDGNKHHGIMNIGRRPTFYDTGNIITEVYVYNFNKDIYGKFVTVNVVERIRGEERFESPEALIEQIKKDTKAGLEILNKHLNLTINN